MCIINNDKNVNNNKNNDNKMQQCALTIIMIKTIIIIKQ